MKWIKRHKLTIALLAVLLLSLNGGNVMAVDGVFIRFIGDEVPADADIIVYNSTDGVYKSVAMSGNATIDNTGKLSLIPRERYYPEIFACSTTANSTSPHLGCEDVDFGGFTLSVVEFQTGDVGQFHLRTPPDYGFGGNTSISISFGWRVEDGSTGGITMSTRAGSTIANCQADSWINSDADPWVQNDEIHWTEYKVIPPNGISSGEQDLYIQYKLLSENCDATQIFIDKIIAKGWGV